MKNKYRLICCVIAFTLIISLACVPAMAHQIGQVVLPRTDTDTQTYVVSSEQSYAESYNDGTVSEASDSFPSYTESSETVSSESNWWDNSDVLPGSDTQSDTVSADTESELVSSEVISEAESVVSVDDSDDYYEESSYQPYSDNNVYTSLYSTVEETTRSVINGDTWSNISIDMTNGDTAGKLNINGGGKGDFSFIKDNNAGNKGKATLYYWLAGGIACLAVGLCGAAFVVITTLDGKKRQKAVAAAKRKRALSRGDTAEINLPKNKRR